MNWLELLLCAALFTAAALLVAYIGALAIEMAYNKYVFEATKKGSCYANSSGKGIIVAMCVEITYEGGGFKVRLFNVTYAS